MIVKYATIIMVDSCLSGLILNEMKKSRKKERESPPTNFLERNIAWIHSKKSLVAIIIVYFMMVGLGNFLDGLGKVINGIQITYAYIFEEKQMTDEALVWESRNLSKEIITYLLERRQGEPVFSFDNFEESTQSTISYSQQTVGYYSSEFQPKVAKYREEFLKRGLINNELDSFYKNATNPIGVESVAFALNDLAASLDAKK